MGTGTCRPYTNGPEITFLGTHKIDELTCKKHAESIDDREYSCNRAVVVVGPVKLRSDKVFPSE